MSNNQNEAKSIGWGNNTKTKQRKEANIPKEQSKQDQREITEKQHEKQARTITAQLTDEQKQKGANRNKRSKIIRNRAAKNK